MPVKTEQQLIDLLINRRPGYFGIQMFENFTTSEMYWFKYDLDAPHRIMRFQTKYQAMEEKSRQCKFGPYAINKVTAIINDGIAKNSLSYKIDKATFDKIMKSIRKNKCHPIVASDDAYTTTLCHVCCKFSRNHQSYLTFDGITICGRCMRHYQPNKLLGMEHQAKIGGIDNQKCIWLDPYVNYFAHPNYKVKHWAKFNSKGKNYESNQRAKMVELQKEMFNISRWMGGKEWWTDEKGCSEKCYKKFRKLGYIVHRWIYNDYGFSDNDGITPGSIMHADWKFNIRTELFKEWLTFYNKKNAGLSYYFGRCPRLNSRILRDYSRVMKELLENNKNFDGILKRGKKNYQRWRFTFVRRVVKKKICVPDAVCENVADNDSDSVFNHDSCCGSCSYS